MAALISSLFCKTIRSSLRLYFPSISPYSTIGTKTSQTPSVHKSSAKLTKSEVRLGRIVIDEFNKKEDEKLNVPEDFPFQISGDTDTLFLKHHFQGETIRVVVRKEKENEGSSPQNLFVIVKLIRKMGISLKFYCKCASSTHFTIYRMQAKPRGPRAILTSPEFSDLDEKLQKVFYSFLEARGIDRSLANFLQYYMTYHDGQNYKGLLYRVRKYLDV
ncbi:uncharacterized protein At2g39795, mitochondrial-like [Tasmannia lanceolata]|uniref:uncharacterized protein At2g39795, mitochondrial-like n=1 Tax=Tasmannia lanceolata TaxID=3420 RepID=UPI004063A1ED